MTQFTPVRSEGRAAAPIAAAALAAAFGLTSKAPDQAPEIGIAFSF